MPRGDAQTGPRPSDEELRRRREERTEALRLREAIDRELERRGVRDPSGIGAVFGLPPRAAEAMLRRYHWREGDLEALRATAARLRVTREQDGRRARRRSSHRVLEDRRLEKSEAMLLRAALGEELARRGLATPRAVGDALGMTPLAALEILRRKHWREGDLALLSAAAARLGLA